MDTTELCERLVTDHGGRILYLVMDGVGGLPDTEDGRTELAAAKTPNLDRLASESSCGLIEIVGPGITPGSGPGHLTLFGYHPRKYLIGRGVLSALGIDFALQRGDVACRINFATLDADGNVVDRRAGRPDTETNRRLCEKLRGAVRLDFGGEWFLETESSHRAVLILRGENLGGGVSDTDPQAEGVPPLAPQALDDESRATAEVIQAFVTQAREALRNEERVTGLLLRGVDQYQPPRSLSARFKLKALCVADYPMYRGVSRLLGMDVAPPDQKQKLDDLKEKLRAYDFCFMHYKDTDMTGEDGDFAAKVAAIERFDAQVPGYLDLGADVVVVTGDHSTPAAMRSHSWHPVPVMMRAAHARVDGVQRFDELSCGGGSLGLRPGIDLMPLALAHAGRLQKFGA